VKRVMNLTNKLYQKFVLNSLDKIDWGDANGAPLVVELDPTAVCDLACPGCISEDIIAVGNSFSNERLMSIGQELIDCGVKAVILIGGGEPLAHPKIGDFITLLGENDVHIGITTNGTFIDRYLGPISKYVQWTRVSFDAATDETFLKLRPTKIGKSRYKKIINNMRNLAKIKKGKLGFSYLIQTKADGLEIDNVNEIYDAAVLAKDIGCDYFEVKPTYNFKNDVPHSLMKHDKELMAQAKSQIEMTYNLEDDNFKIIEAINLKYSLNGDVQHQEKNYKTCPSTHLRTTITPGGAYVCPYWRGKERMKIGDINTTSVADMLNSELRKEVMSNLDAKLDCTFHCLRNDTNNECFSLKEKLEKSESVEVVSEFDRFI
jgi:MoaA/NifB/PqqE/SkfB family radical SAM enzyme